MGLPAFERMSAHGAAVRPATSNGQVILSSLKGGVSQIRALAPSIKYVLQGEEVYTICGRTFKIRAGEFMLVESGLEVGVRTPNSDRTLGLCIYFGSSLPTTAQELCLELALPALVASRIDPLASELQAYAKLISQNSDAACEIAPRLMSEITNGIRSFVCRVNERISGMSAAKWSTRIEIFQRLERVREFIHSNKERQITLDELAIVAALSPFHLNRSFREVYGRAPVAYHRTLRLFDAHRRLRTGEASAGQLSRQLGYASITGFSRAFNREFGFPPSRIRLA